MLLKNLFIKSARVVGEHLIFVWLRFARNSVGVGSNFVVVGRLLGDTAETPRVPLREDRELAAFVFIHG